MLKKTTEYQLTTKNKGHKDAKNIKGKTNIVQMQIKGQCRMDNSRLVKKVMFGLWTETNEEVVKGESG